MYISPKKRAGHVGAEECQGIGRTEDVLWPLFSQSIDYIQFRVYRLRQLFFMN